MMGWWDFLTVAFTSFGYLFLSHLSLAVMRLLFSPPVDDLKQIDQEHINEGIHQVAVYLPS